MNFLLGSIVVIGCVLGGYAMEDGHLMALVQPAELLIIGGAAMGAFFISNPTRTLRECAHGVSKLLKGAPYDREFHTEALSLLYTILMKIRKEGAMALEGDIDDPAKSSVFTSFPRVAADARTVEFVCDYFRIMVSGGMNSYEIESLMDIDMESASHSAKKPAEALMFLSESLPGFGIVAAVMGVVITMASVGGPMAELGHKVAAALVGTFLGILLAYGFFGPASRYLQNLAEEEEQFFICIKTCIVAHLNGYAPKMAIEFGRMAVSPDIRPNNQEMEEYFRAVKSR